MEVIPAEASSPRFEMVKASSAGSPSSLRFCTARGFRQWRRSLRVVRFGAAAASVYVTGEAGGHIVKDDNDGRTEGSRRRLSRSRDSGSVNTARQDRPLCFVLPCRLSGQPCSSFGLVL